MKMHLRNFIFALLLHGALLSETASAQTTAPAPPRQVYYFEMGGNGLGLSFNREFRLSDHFSARTGVGHVFVAVTAPFTVSYMTKGSHKFEIGGGVTYAKFDFLGLGSAKEFFTGKPNNAADIFLPTAIIGYRYQRQKSGHFFRVGLTPILGGGEIFPLVGISIGYAR